MVIITTYRHLTASYPSSLSVSRFYNNKNYQKSHFWFSKNSVETPTSAIDVYADYPAKKLPQSTNTSLARVRVSRTVRVRVRVGVRVGVRRLFYTE